MPEPRPATTDLEALLARARAGDAAAENALFALLRARVFAVAKKRIREAEAAHDIAQDTMRTAFEKYRDADLEHGLLPWIFTILHHKVGNYLKRQRTEGARREPGDVREPRWETLAAAPDDRTAMLEIATALDRALPRLPDECRRIFALLVQGAGRAEITAAFAGEPQGTVDSRVSRCRARLLQLVEGLLERRRR